MKKKQNSEEQIVAILCEVAEAGVVINEWRRKYNAQHPHSRLGFISPNDFSKLWQRTKQTVLRFVRTTPSMRQGLVQQPTTQLT